VVSHYNIVASGREGAGGPHGDFYFWGRRTLWKQMGLVGISGEFWLGLAERKELVRGW